MIYIVGILALIIYYGLLIAFCSMLFIHGVWDCSKSKIIKKINCTDTNLFYSE